MVLKGQQMPIACDDEVRMGVNRALDNAVVRFIFYHNGDEKWF